MTGLGAPEHVLEDALSKSSLADDQSSVMVLQSPGDNLRSGCRILIDKDDDRLAWYAVVGLGGPRFIEAAVGFTRHSAFSAGEVSPFVEEEI